MSRLTDILEQSSDTKALETGSGAIGKAVRMFRQLFPGKRPVIVAHSATYALAGDRLMDDFKAAGLVPDEPIIFTEPDLHAEWKYIERLDSLLSATDAVPVALGSGTVNDLTKLSSHHCHRRYMTVGTAASMDGYTAFGASITKDGAKQTFSCPAPLGFIADTDIIATAPEAMTASGYADLYAKVPAGADWILSDALLVEPVDERAFDTVQNGLKTALAEPAALRRGDKKALAALTEGLLFGGFAMQIHRSSRPASGAEHQLSHLWNMEHHVMADGTTPSHGFQVAVGTLLSTALYEEMLREDFSIFDIEKAVEAWPSLEEILTEARRLFKDTDFPEIGAQEQTAKYIGRESLRRQLEILSEEWPSIKRRISRQIVPLDTVREAFALVGAPVRPQDIGITPRCLRESAVKAQYIRRRFTILDLGVRTDLLDKWLDAAIPRIS